MTVRIRSRVWASEIDRVSSRGAVPNTSAVTAGWAWSPPNQSRNEVMPACATSPTHERSSADSDRYHSWSVSICCTAAAPRSPAARATRARVAADGIGRWVDGIRRVYLYAVHNPTAVERAGQSVPDSIAARSSASSSPPWASGLAVIWSYPPAGSSPKRVPFSTSSCPCSTGWPA